MKFISMDMNGASIVALEGLKEIAIVKKLGVDRIIFKYNDGSELFWSYFDSDTECSETYRRIKKLLGAIL